MAMAHNSPKTRNRTHTIPHHAIERCREYVNDERLGHFRDHAVGDLLDRYIVEAMSQEAFEVWFENDDKRGEVARNFIVSIGNRFDGVVGDGRLFALMRPMTDRPEDTGKEMICLTLLTGEQVDRSKGTRWHKTREAIRGTRVTQSPFAQLADRKPAVANVGNTKPREATVTKLPARGKREVITGECVVLVWHDGEVERFARVLVGDLDKFVARLVLVDDVEADSIEVFEASPRKVRLRVEIT